jgi:uncharacterized protein YfaS (alpha-2-macroglobulin family)
MAKNIKLAVNSESKGFSVTRRYFLKDPTTQKFVEASLPASSAKSTANNVKAPNIVLKRGGLVRIELKVVVPASRYHVALEDSLPGGLEPLNLELATTSQTVSEATEGESEAVGSFEDWLSGAAFYHTEKRDTGALYFAQTLAPGEYKVSYTAQAIATGVFTARPAKVEEMYSPDIYGRTAAQVFEIKD